ncbi:MAG: DegT/DnrJ/EryC1/StrS family aminotransferase [Armatimonadetes bacterium]|nr:DegT/DnrJ/EryC1/StrS family aminotransferase [Armatimonadota bacterium]
MEQLAINGGTPVRDVKSRPWPQWPIWDERDVQAVNDVIRSGAWTGATQVNAFAQEFAQFHEARFGVCNASCTISLQSALRAAGVGMGDEVIVPPYTFIAVPTVVLLVNAVPVFADIDPDTHTLDPKAAEAAITPRTRAILVVHHAGCPADMDAFPELARKHNLALIEDCATAHTSAWRGRKVGAIGDMGGFSFNASKTMTAGEGGIIVTDNEEYYERCASIVNVGRLVPGAKYEHTLAGTNLRMTEFQAALLRVQLTRMPEQAARRWENGLFLNRELAKIPGIRPMKLDERVTGHSFRNYPFRFDAAQFGRMTRAEFTKALSAEGVPCGGGARPLYRDSLFRPQNTYAGTQMDYSKVYCPVAERAAEEEAVMLRQTQLLGTREDTQDIIDAVAKVQRAASR